MKLTVLLVTIAVIFGVLAYHEKTVTDHEKRIIILETKFNSK